MHNIGINQPVYWQEGYNLDAAFAHVIDHVYKSLAPLGVNAWVYDLGGGDGRFVRNAPAEHCYAVYVVETIKEALTRYEMLLKSRGRNSIAVRGDVADPKVYTIQADAAFMWRVLHALPRELHAKVLQLIFEHLKPGAALHIAVLSEADWECQEIEQYVRGQMHDLAPVRGLKEPFPAFFFWEKYFRESLERAGFKIVAFDRFTEGTGYEKNKLEGRPPHSFFYAHALKPAA